MDEQIAINAAADEPVGATPGDDSSDENLTDTACATGRRKFMELSGLGGGALFVLIPNSELVHSALRAVLGVGGYQCC